MDKKTVLAVALSAAVLIIYYGFIYKPPKPTTPPQATPEATETGAPVAEASGTPVPTSGETQASAPIPESAPTVQQVKQPLVTTKIETPLIETDLITKSGFPLHWWLKKFYEQADHKGPHIDLLKGKENTPPFGLIIFPGKSAFYPYYTIKQQSDHSITYQSQIGNLAVEQQLDFGDQDYAVDVTLRVANQSQTPQTLSPGLRIFVPEVPKPEKKGFLRMGPAPNILSPLYRLGTKVERKQKVDKLGIYTEQVGDISWVGLEDRYFLRAILARSLSSQNKTAYGKKGSWIFSDFVYPPDTVAGGATKEYAFTLYLGPKDPTYLNQFAGAELGNAIDYGWFGIIARPILLSMKFFYGFLRNWGLAIILLTIIIKLLLYPLTRKSMASMKAMQHLQPQLKALREKYKDNKEKLNLETMDLFRRNKVNPMGGCLPMVIQMPIYIALYKVLYNATELYHAPFFWFYRDLSAPDPYYILPVLMGISMVAQQKMTPSTGDATQQKMMMIMPIMFTVFMLFLPVGLVLYIFVNTAMTVIQQYMHQHDLTFMGLLKGKKT